jgi:tight adherence protein B
MKKRHLGAALAAVVAGLLLFSLPASAQTADENLSTRIREISFDSNGNTRVVVSVAGSALTTETLGTGNFAVTEQGLPVPGLAVEPLFQSKNNTVAVVVLVDLSQSTQGKPLESAKLAAKSFVGALPIGVQIAVAGFGSEVRITQDFTTDRVAVNSAIDALQTAGTTSLYDGVVQSAELLSRRVNAQRNVVIFSDGADSSSKASLQDAISALKTTSTSATTVLLSTSHTDQLVLSRLADAVKGGLSLTVSDAAKLQAAFARAAQALASQYVLTYPGKDKATKELDIRVDATLAGFQASDSSVVINLRSQAQPQEGPPPAPKPLVGAFGGNLGLYLGIGAAFIGAALFIGMLLWAPAGRAGDRALARRLRLYTRSGERKEKPTTTAGALSASAVGRRAVALVEKFPRPAQFDEKMQAELDQAGWPIRGSEFILIQIGAFVGGFLIGGVLLRRFWMGLVFAVLGAVLPRVLLTAQIQRRATTFLAQLPDTLQLLAGSLSAGYGFLQALDTIAKETTAPTSTEFARVLSEARLGRPVEDALESMADRVGGEDFKWVVLAINIQRQVGGNLAALLTTVSNTLREREQVRRQIKVLSAEGKLSAYILVALPFVLFGYLSLINPDYVHELTKATIGKIMIVGAIFLIGVGALWMRKIIKIDV